MQATLSMVQFGRVTGILFSLVALGGCDSGTNTPLADQMLPKSSNIKVVIAFVGRGETDPLWPALKNDAERFAAQWSLEIRCSAPATATHDAQVELLNSLDQQEFNGLCIHAVDPDRIQAEIKRFQSRGVCVVSIIERLPRGFSSNHVGFDDRVIGKTLADETARMLNGSGNIMLLHAGLDDMAMTLRLAEFRGQIRRHDRVAVLAQEDCGADPRRAREIIRDKMARYPNLAAWVALDDWPLRGVTDGTDSLPESTRIILWSTRPETWSFIRNQTVAAMVSADCSELGSMAVRFCSHAIKNPAAADQLYFAPIRTVLPGNLDTFTRDWEQWAADSEPAPSMPGGVE